MTSPFGINLFPLKKIVPPGISVADIHRAVIPYTLVELARMGLFIFFPGSPFGCR